MSTNKTTNLQLNDWAGSDRFIREEINENFRKIDSSIGSLQKTRAYSNSLNKGRLLSDFTKWSLWYGTVTQDTEHVRVGDSSLKVSTDVSNSTSAARLRSVSFDFSKVKTIMIRFFVPNITKLSNIELRFSAVDNMVSYLSWKTTRWKLAEGWNEVLIPISQLTVVGGATFNSRTTTLQISVTGNEGITDASVIFDAIYVNRVGKGNVIFAFDDGWLSQYTKAFPILLSKGFVGNIGVIRDAVGTSRYMTLAQLKTLHEYGWDLFNHTSTHRDLTTITETEVKTDIDGCKAYLLSHGFERAADIVAYPYGRFNTAVLNAMQGYRLGRAVHEEYEVTPPIQPFALKVVSMLNTTTSSEYEKVINTVVETGGTVILLLHEIEDTGTSSTIFLTSQLQSLVDFVHSKSAELNVLTMSEWANSFS